VVVSRQFDLDGAAGGEGRLETLCSVYWNPVYFYLRRRGRDPEDARDLTQGFFALLLERHWFKEPVAPPPSLTIREPES
jgi:DNA-directed RNA polymerase specialized sigma24 family protein